MRAFEDSPLKRRYSIAYPSSTVGGAQSGARLRIEMPCRSQATQRLPPNSRNRLRDHDNAR